MNNLFIISHKIIPKDSFIKKLANAPIYPIFDDANDWDKTGGRNYELLDSTVKNVFFKNSKIKK